LPAVIYKIISSTNSFTIYIKTGIIKATSLRVVVTGIHIITARIGAQKISTCGSWVIITGIGVSTIKNSRGRLLCEVEGKFTGLRKLTSQNVKISVSSDS
jgi:hypothetical protein